MTSWHGRRVLVIGAGRQGTALAAYLARHGAEVVLNDRRPQEALAAARERLADWPIHWVVGGHPLEALEGVDLVCPSGGVPLTLPLIQEAVRRGVLLSNEAQIFLEAAPCPVVGITGSAGKTTTTTLVGRMAASAAGEVAGISYSHDEAQAADLPRRWRKVWVGGNIGNPLIADVDAMQPDDLAVMELSSFQLELMTRSPQVAAVLNITPNHLDRHGTMAAYTAAKARIVDFQGPEDWAVLGREDPGAWGLRPRIRGRLLTFGVAPPPRGVVGTFVSGDTLRLRTSSGERDLFPREVLRLRGEHNLRNGLAAAAVAHALGLTPAHMRAGVEGFAGVPHRLELVRELDGVAWYNDSIATAPERAMAAIRSFVEPIVLLAGGCDKKLPWDAWAQLVRQRVRVLIAFGEARDLILEALAQAEGPLPEQVLRCDTLEEAVRAAYHAARPGDVVLLSPGGTSFDEFRDFAERGARFRQWVEELP
ncbi:MAG TPA: UDP-N-acetylmuramoyl-L-alanine--D-glutamate ligase [Anaerolineae bacterium]|nr:UDP-N-acetylmuramoyl-L-alanine--D-glutamate ligase [Anaerolineae bacterium]HIQ09178.1 UDP-N-acetylmuramoyl-L-alanine--D-glutamate ligase [Anaerolineaceae bacterium]